jgi:hypothetical protein
MDQGMKSYWAEWVGTFTLCFIGQGAICVQQMIGSQGTSLLPVAVAHGLALAVMISALGAVSGGHFNPAVTFGFLVTGRQTLGSAAAYWVSQLLGAVVASVLLRSLFPVSVWQSVYLGAAALSPEVSATGGLVIEFVLTRPQDRRLRHRARAHHGHPDGRTLDRRRARSGARLRCRGRRRVLAGALDLLGRAHAGRRGRGAGLLARAPQARLSRAEDAR